MGHGCADFRDLICGNGNANPCATDGDSVIGLVIRDALRVAGMGVCLALPIAWASGRMLSSLLAGITGVEIGAIAAAAVLAAAMAAMASYLPARRAARVDPLAAIRHS